MPAAGAPSAAAPRVYLRKGRERRITAGHLWVYAGEVERASPDVEPGAPVDIVDHRGRFVARGYYNAASNIVARVMSRRRDEAVDDALLRRRIARAVAYRRQFHPAGESCRLVFGEGDLLPGLIVDRYGHWLAVQISTRGMDRARDAIVAALQDAVHPRGIYERSDLAIRSREGLEPRTGVLAGEVPDEVEVTIDALRFVVNVKESQKTGLYLDHRLNRRALQAHAAGRRMLDVFSNTGSFALYALAAGASRAVAVESSADAVAAARRNASLNEFSARAEWIEGNAFDTLRDMERRKERFDLIVLDPPAFTRSASAVAAAVRGYKEINLRALRLASPGAMVVSASCSYHLGPEEFVSVLRDAAADAGRDVTLVSLTGQAPDHPVNLAVPETRYLKCAFLHVH